MEGKKYWLKLEKNFLQSKYIKVIKNMHNGQDYILFYLALMLESIDTVGHLRFTELVPYNEDMLSSLTDTNIDIVRAAMKLFQDLGMISVLQDGTIFLPEVPALTGAESDSAERVRRFRARKKQDLLQCNGDVTSSNDEVTNSNKKVTVIKEEKRREEEEKDIEEECGNSDEQPEFAELPESEKEAQRLAQLLNDLHEQEDPGYSGKVKSWVKDIEKLIRIDERPPGQIEKVIRWSKTPGNFWFPNIMSGKKLRDKYPTLLAQSLQRNKASPKKASTEGYKINDFDVVGG